MLQSLLAYARGAGADVRWMTISGNPEFFTVTKRLHNHLHESAGDGGQLGPDEHKRYEAALAEAADELCRDGPTRGYRVHPRPTAAGIDPPLKDKDLKVVWRCHIGADEPVGWRGRRGTSCARTSPRRTPMSSRAWSSSGTGSIASGSGSCPRRSTPSPRRIRSSALRGGIDPRRGGIWSEDHSATPRFTATTGPPARVGRPRSSTRTPRCRAMRRCRQVSRWDRLKDPAECCACSPITPTADAHLLLAGPSRRGGRRRSGGREVLAEVREQRDALPPEKRARVHLASLPMDDVGRTRRW